MSKVTKTMLTLGAALLLVISTNSHSINAKEDGISGRASAVDKNDANVVNSDENRERTADSLEAQADQIRKNAEIKADKLEDRADRIRDGH